MTTEHKPDDAKAQQAQQAREQRLGSPFSINEPVTLEEANKAADEFEIAKAAGPPKPPAPKAEDKPADAPPHHKAPEPPHKPSAGRR